MKPYGNTPYQNLTCRGGCCSSGAVRTRYHSRIAKPYLRSSRKRARHLAKKLSEVA